MKDGSKKYKIQKCGLYILWYNIDWYPRGSGSLYTIDSTPDIEHATDVVRRLEADYLSNKLKSKRVVKE